MPRSKQATEAAKAAGTYTGTPGAPNGGTPTGGRPTKLTPEVQAKIVTDLEAGLFADTAAMCAGIDPSTYYTWLRHGEQGLEPYASFLAAVTIARAVGEKNLFLTAAAGDPAGISNGPAKCALNILEKTRGKRYAARINVKVEEELESLIDVVERICSAKDCGCYEELLRALRSRDSGEAFSPVGVAEVPKVH